MNKKRRFKKRFIPIILLVLLMVTAHGCLTFRISDSEWENNLVKKGQKKPNIKTYHFDGRNIHYIHIGEDTLPLVVFLHGSPGSSSAFEDYLADTNLTKEAQLISVDRPGFGYSDFGIAAQSLAEQSRMLKPILERHPAPKVILVGHSLGGPLIARMTMDYPELIDHLVILAGSIAPELEPYEWYREPLNWKVISWSIPTVMRVSNQEILPVKEDLEEMLPLWRDIKIPVTVIHGQKDRLVPVENADFAKKVLVNSPKVDIILYPEEDHFIPWTKYDEIVGKITALIHD
jgi:pimeloyl-ACP methyl ester carboxylesterase